MKSLTIINSNKGRKIFMTTFNVVGIGTVTILRGTLSCNISVSPAFFIRKFRNYLIKFPQSILDILKTAILSKNTEFQYKEIYYHTLIDFFTKIQNGKDQDRKSTLQEQETSIHKAISNISNNGKIHSFMEKRNKNQNYPVEISTINNKVSEKSIQTQFGKINRLIEDGKFQEAKSIITLTLSQLRFLKNMDEIEQRLMVCQTYIELVEDLNQIKDLIKRKEFDHAITQLKDRQKFIDKLDLSMELFNHINYEYLSITRKLKDERRKALSTISDTIIQITNLLRIAEYNTSYHLLQKITTLASNWKFSHISDKIHDLEQNVRNEQIILSELLTFAQLHITRIHISELMQKTSLSEEKIEKIVKKFISDKIIHAKFDPNTKGIEFQHFQQEIDNLMQNFHDWETDSNSKKTE
ncbi:hypothetical protein NEF87_003876 [Candidatus Lokiarchaeum ossiferum]|uniref:PCI domain-containing protein n=1 Tax=Candidatus Lokiarchaeum ossiferum TaxID=2951803 RepID=A0ABY6HVN5_9ARCH|nr:hypothetical protein NEF87_003876 [Candidatus Lokiarchaeum sp. B-35]